MAPLAAPEPMNATTSHSKLKVTVTLPGESVVAGRHVTGKMEVECKSDKLGIGIVMVELFAFQELTSRDHSARMTFLHTRRLFQGPNLPPSNAVHAHPLPGDPPFPEGYYKAKRGHSTFLFRIPLPPTSPASVNFADGLAKVRYEVRGSVGVFWKDERQLVTDKAEVGVVESFEEDLFGVGGQAKAEEGVVVVGEGGRFWMHGRIIGGILVAGESACVELQVKNHSNRKNSGLILSLHRTLLLPTSTNNTNVAKPLQISDTILTVPYKGPEYTLPPGGEGVAHLVFDVPANARSVRGGIYEGDGDDEQRNTSEALFCVQATVEVKVSMGMGLGSKDIVLDIPVTIVHPDALPETPHLPPPVQPQTHAVPEGMVYPQYIAAPRVVAPATHIQQPYIDHQAQQVWIPPPQHAPYQQYYPDHGQGYYAHQPQPYPYPQQETAYTHLNLPPPPRHLPPRPSSAGPLTTSPSHARANPYEPPISGLPISPVVPYGRLLPLPAPHQHQQSTPPRQQYPGHHHNPNHVPSSTSPQSPTAPNHHHHQQQYASPQANTDLSPSQWIEGEREEGKGDVASRISRHLRQTSVATGRGRSVSPVAHRFGYPTASAIPGVSGGASRPGLDAQTGDGTPVAPVAQVDVAGTGAGTGAILHSPRPQIRHKQSFTKLDGKTVMKSESVVELEKMAARLDDSANGVEVLRAPLGRRGKDGKGKDESPPAPGQRLSLSPEDVNVNKTLPVPPPLTKPRHLVGDRANGNGVSSSTPLESLFASSPVVNTHPIPTSPTVNISADTNSAANITTINAVPGTGIANALSLSQPAENYQTPPTPTLVAYKRPPRLDTGFGGASDRGGAGENGLDALERRLVAQVGTRKVEKEKRPDVRDILNSAGGVTVAAKEKDGGGVPTSVASVSTSTTPNPEANGHGTGGSTSVSSEKLQDANDESAISSLTLDQSSVNEDVDDREGQKERQKEREREDEEQEQESVDGGKTHRAGKSVVGVESYFQTHNYTHRRERAGIEPTPAHHIAPTVIHNGASSRPTTVNSTPKRRAAVAADKSKKSAQARGRVAAWLGNIDPDVPPQEEIIPPSPSVVKLLDLNLDGEGVAVGRDRVEEEDRESRKESRGRRDRAWSRTRVGSRSRSWSPPPIPAPVPISEPKHTEREPESSIPSSAAASPNPRSSGFMPIGTMQAQRDSITKSMTRSMMRRVGVASGIGREMTVVKEARKVMDIWSEGLPPPTSTRPTSTSPNSPTPAAQLEVKDKDGEKKMQYPFMAPIPPKTQTIRTDRRVSPPSTSVGAAALGVDKSIAESPGPEPGPHTVIGRASLVPPPPLAAGANAKAKESPKSYANAVNTGPTRAGTAGVKNLRLPVFPPPPRQEPEVKYDIRSARGGRGGKVTHVASLWASVAAGNAAASTGNTPDAGAKPPERGVGWKKGMPVKGKAAISTSNALNPEGKRVPTPTRPASHSATVFNAKDPRPPLPPRKPTTATSPSPNTTTATLNAPQAKTPTPASNPKVPTPASNPKVPTPASNPKAPTPTPTMPKSTTNQTQPRHPGLPPTSVQGSTKNLNSKSAPIAVAMTKSPSVPATVSSSFATPTLSSTASLARPIGSSASKTLTVAVGLPGIGKGDYKDSTGGHIRDGSSNAMNSKKEVARKRPGLGGIGEEGADLDAGPKLAAKGRGGVASARVGAMDSGIDGVGGGSSGNVKTNATVAAGGENGKRPPPRDAAFGQTRLRDLIKKYQAGNA